MEHEADSELNAMCECREAMQSTQCEDCIGYHLTCTQCFICNHQHSWNHWALVWDVRGFFTWKDIHELAYIPQLGHHGAECPVPHTPVKMIIVDVNSIHDTYLHFCGCQRLTVDHVSQLMHVCLFPSTTNLPQLTFSFQLLWQFQLLHVECTTKYDGHLAKIDGQQISMECICTQLIQICKHHCLLGCLGCHQADSMSILMPWFLIARWRICWYNVLCIQRWTGIWSLALIQSHKCFSQYFLSSEVIKPKGGGRVSYSSDNTSTLTDEMDVTFIESPL